MGEKRIEKNSKASTFFNKKENCWYRADPDTKKKAMENGDGTGWF